MKKKKTPKPPPDPIPITATGPLRNRALAELAKLAPSLPAASPSPTPPPPPPPPKPRPDVWRPNLDRDLFNVAMAGVKPLGAARGAAGRVGPARRADAATGLRRTHAEGAAALIDVRWQPDGTVEGLRRGRTFALEALERFMGPEDTLDLHGLDAETARVRIGEFVRTRKARGMKVVCVVVGVGKHASDGTSVLRDAAVKALTEAPAVRDVDAFRTAPQRHGGAGALMVALRT